MCGFVGGFYSNGSCYSVANLEKASILLSHRGPDQSSSKKYDHSFGVFVSSHRRLSIIDLSENGLQPMVGSFDSSILTYNGELYNYIELRDELKHLGLSFETESDTEVVLKSLETWGHNALSKFNGMFSLVYFDGLRNEMIIARDPFGIKPLFYTMNSNSFSFASEIPALLKQSSAKPTANLTAIKSYIDLGVNRNSETTFFEKINSVKPGHYLKIQINEGCNLSIEKNQWYENIIESSESVSFDEAAKKLGESFLDEVRLQLRSDVPIALTLSGGIDSSAIACAVRYLEPEKKIKTFSYDSDAKDTSEKKWFESVNKYINAEAQLIKITNNDFICDLQDLIKTQSEPFISSSIYAQFCVHKTISKEGIKVVLGGQGADEVFGGYTGYPYHTFNDFIDNKGYKASFKFLFNYKKKFKKPILTYVISSIKNRYLTKKSLHLASNNNHHIFLKNNFFKNNSPSKYNETSVTTKPYKDGYLKNHLMKELVESKIPNLLRYEDRNSMRWSIESRVPFLNPNLIKLTQSLPFHYLVSDDCVTKNIFREAMRGIVPDEVLDRTDKIGFETPEKKLIQDNLDELKKLILNCDNLPFVDKTKFIDYAETNLSSNNSYDPMIWRIINLYLWSNVFTVDYN